MKDKQINSALLQQAQALDMAAEAHQLLRGEANQEIPGVRHTESSFACGQINIIEILDAQGAELMGRAEGTYITIEVPDLKNDLNNSSGQLLPVSQAVAEALQSVMPADMPPEAGVLVVGLGNYQTTADAIGPKTISYIQPTRHFYQKDWVEEIRPVAAISPGVVGNTGIETALLIKGVVRQIKPACLIVIDALAARSISNIMSSIQICNTGIRPGSGVQNRRQAVNQAYLGVPVIAVGIPTVVHGATIIRESADLCMQRLAAENPPPGLADELVETLLRPFADNLVVTPKEADALVPLAARIIAAGITRALHPAADEEHFAQYMQIGC